MGSRSVQSASSYWNIESISSPISATTRWNKGPKVALFVHKDAIQLSLSDHFSCTGASAPLLAWLEQYLTGRAPPLSLPLVGSPFQQQVMQTLLQIPFGGTLSYRDLAHLSGSPRAARAVGNACGRNRFPLLIPCHRVIHANGALGGFSLDIEIKKRLLEFERTQSLPTES